MHAIACRFFFSKLLFIFKKRPFDLYGVGVGGDYFVSGFFFRTPESGFLFFTLDGPGFLFSQDHAYKNKQQKGLFY